jgi:hypothetical protein
MGSPQIGKLNASVDESASYPASNKTRASSNIVGMQRVVNGPGHRKNKTVMNSQALGSIQQQRFNQAQRAVHQSQEDPNRHQSPEMKSKTMRGPKLASYDGSP